MFPVYCANCGEEMGKIDTEDAAQALKKSSIYCTDCADELEQETSEDDDDEENDLTAEDDEETEKAK